jgi:diketogulonate reductase-like aldo/keto reductase
MANEQTTPGAGPRVDGMPMLGLGTWQNEEPAQCAESVETALEMGYRHVDTAQIYRNEAAVGDGLQAADVDREDVFLATKVWTDRLTREGVLESTAESLEKLGTDYVDLLYVHWPAGEYDPEETLPAFDELRDEGRIRHVGVSNFEPGHVDRARELLDAPVFANQIELHPLLPQTDLREYARRTGLNLVAYSPLARGEVFDVPALSAIADEHGVNEARVSLAWLRETGVTAIPKATGREHIRDNFGSLDLQLSPTEIERIDDIGRTDRQIHPDFAPAEWG